MSKYIFKSSYKDHIANYIDLMVSNGCREYSFYYLKQFDNFLYENNYIYSELNKEILDKWSIQKDSELKNSRNDRICRVRSFCKYLNSIGVFAYISRDKLSNTKTYPYILSKEEINILFETIDKSSKELTTVKHYKFMLPIFFRLLYNCGIRNNEGCSLKQSNIDISKNTLTILDAKNKVDRMVYITNDMANLLKSYLNKLNQIVKTDFIFPSSDFKKHIDKTTIDYYFKKFINKSKIGNKDFHPVPHSLRHTYVVHRVDLWLQEGKNVNQLLNYLSKQLGHSSLSETYYYYHMLNTSFEFINNKSRNLFPEVRRYEE